MMKVAIGRGRGRLRLPRRVLSLGAHTRSPAVRERAQYRAVATVQGGLSHAGHHRPTWWQVAEQSLSQFNLVRVVSLARVEWVASKRITQIRSARLLLT